MGDLKKVLKPEKCKGRLGQGEGMEAREVVKIKNLQN